MSYRLDEVVPWGRTLDEYQRMFALTPEDLSRRIIGCGDGPASFNAEATGLGHNVTSVDPIYAFDKAAIEQRVSEVFDTVMGQVADNAAEFVWGKPIQTLEDLASTRSKAIEDFLDDYPVGAIAGRYVNGGLPDLPFGDAVFDLALCSHYLFLYSEQVDLAEHVASVEEMCRIAGEVRIFPLQELGSRVSRHLQAVISHLNDSGHSAEVHEVDYEFQKGGNQMLVARQTVTSDRS